MKSFDVVGFGSIIIDDINYADGTTRVGIIGGAAPYALSGASLLGVNTTIWGFAGQNYYSEIENYLNARSIGTEGLALRSIIQPRAFQNYDHHANRTEVFQTPWEDVRKYAPNPEEFPENVECRSGYLFVAENIKGYCEAFRKAGVKYQTWEPPEDLFSHKKYKSRVLENIKEFDVIVPNFSEMNQLFEFDSYEPLIDLILSSGVNIVALRMGKNGSVIASSQATVIFPVEPVEGEQDFTGAGNAFAGAISAALLKQADPESLEGLIYIGACASVASTMIIESRGLPIINNQVIERFNSRLEKYVERNF